MDLLNDYAQLLTSRWEKLDIPQRPQGLYDPIRYIMQLGGKRLRPALVLLGCEAAGGKPEDAVAAAEAIEIFHNFTLVHDDIMDRAELRRGKKTVHKKYDLNTGILSGDAMLILAYQKLGSYSPEVHSRLTTVFSQTAIEVCEGQQHDVDFEARDDVSLDEYLRMISFKTAVLVGCALKMGAIVGHGQQQSEGAVHAASLQNTLYDFGMQLGLAFQIMDDFLDAFGDPETFGKTVGGDILENKKTYLYHKALENRGYSDELNRLYTDKDVDADHKISRAKTIFKESGAAEATQKAIEEHTEKAMNLIQQSSLDEQMKERFYAFAKALLHRKS